MIRLLLVALVSILLLIQSVGFAQFADRYAHTEYVHTRYVAGSSSITVEKANFRLILSPAGSTLVDLSIEKLPDTPIELRLRDDTRYTLFSCRSRTESPLFVRRIDLRELDNGTYWLDVQVGKNRLTRKLRLVSISNTEQTVMLDE
ncbi:hypothetical protein [uncultured Fibrella sp.]|uniref:hypothetical protein n=1 Tax=uncultured Fibrella sp. TaxID=1284596 RepID=UPI0035C997FC